jgi:hypothetical protein
MKNSEMFWPGLTGLAALAVSLLILLPGCTQEEAVRYSWHVQPIIEKHCLACHQKGGQGYEASGFSMETYEDFMRGTKYGPMVIPGDSEGSNLLVLMEGRADPSIKMPHGGLDPVPQTDIDTIRRWIDQGAKNN